MYDIYNIYLYKYIYLGKPCNYKHTDRAAMLQPPMLDYGGNWRYSHEKKCHSQ